MTHLLLRILLANAIGLACAPLPVLAQNQDLEAVRRAAEQFARAQTESLSGEIVVEAGALDQRLQLAACQSLQAYLPAGARLWGRSNVGVRCQRPENWSVMVPVTVQVMVDALYAARALPRGEPVADQDITTQRVDLTQLPAGALTDRSQAIGRVPNVSLAAGLPLRADVLRGAFVVTRGQTVRIMFSAEGFKVSSEGQALGNAAAGEYVQVRAASGKVVKGRASSAGVVEVK
jgi:flagellar basal body P-ring formation protein FlgA